MYSPASFAGTSSQRETTGVQKKGILEGRERERKRESCIEKRKGEV